MARPLRINPEMGMHHVYTRGTKRWTLFHDDVDRRRFMGTLSKVCDRYGIEVLAFCLMDNHIHLVVRCPDAQLSDAMRDLKSLYARWFNHRHRSSGPIFEDRFGSKLVTSHQQLRTLVRYVHRNPYAIDPFMRLADFAWSSHPIYLGLRPAPAWLDKSAALGLFTDYRFTVERPIQTDAIQNSVIQSPPSEQVPGTCSLSIDQFSLAAILISVSQAARCPIADVSPAKRNGLIGVAAMIALGDGGFTATEIAEPFGYRTPEAVFSAARRGRVRVANDTSLQQILSTALYRLTQQAAA